MKGRCQPATLSPSEHILIAMAYEQEATASEIAHLRPSQGTILSSLIEIQPVATEDMLFAVLFSFFSSDGNFVQRSQTIRAILLEDFQTNNPIHFG